MLGLWYRLIISANQEVNARGQSVLGSPGLESEFEASLGSLAEPVIKRKLGI